MLTEIEKLNHEIEKLDKESQTYKNNHEWGDWNNWQDFVKLDIEILDLKKKVLNLEKEALIDALKSYENY